MGFFDWLRNKQETEPDTGNIEDLVNSVMENISLQEGEVFTASFDKVAGSDGHFSFRQVNEENINPEAVMNDNSWQGTVSISHKGNKTFVFDSVYSRDGEELEYKGDEDHILIESNGRTIHAKIDYSFEMEQNDSPKRIPHVSYKTSDGREGEFTKEQSAVLMSDVLDMEINKADNIHYTPHWANSVLHAKIIEEAVGKKEDKGLNQSPEEIRKDISAIILTDKEMGEELSAAAKEAAKRRRQYKVAKDFVVLGKTAAALAPFVSQAAMMMDAYAHEADVQQDTVSQKNIGPEAEENSSNVHETRTITETKTVNNAHEVERQLKASLQETDRQADEMLKAGMEEINNKYDAQAENIKSDAANAKAEAVHNHAEAVAAEHADYAKDVGELNNQRIAEDVRYNSAVGEIKTAAEQGRAALLAEKTEIERLSEKSVYTQASHWAEETMESMPEELKNMEVHEGTVIHDLEQNSSGTDSFKRTGSQVMDENGDWHVRNETVSSSGNMSKNQNLEAGYNDAFVSLNEDGNISLDFGEKDGRRTTNMNPTKFLYSTGMSADEFLKLSQSDPEHPAVLNAMSSLAREAGMEGVSDHFLGLAEESLSQYQDKALEGISNDLQFVNQQETENLNQAETEHLIRGNDILEDINERGRERADKLDNFKSGLDAEMTAIDTRQAEDLVANEAGRQEALDALNKEVTNFRQTGYDNALKTAQSSYVEETITTTRTIEPEPVVQAAPSVQEPVQPPASQAFQQEGFVNSGMSMPDYDPGLQKRREEEQKNVPSPTLNDILEDINERGLERADNLDNFKSGLDAEMTAIDTRLAEVLAANEAGRQEALDALNEEVKETESDILAPAPRAFTPSAAAQKLLREHQGKPPVPPMSATAQKGGQEPAVPSLPKETGQRYVASQQARILLKEHLAGKEKSPGNPPVSLHVIDQKNEKTA